MTTTTATGFKATAKFRKHRIRSGRSQADLAQVTGLGQAGVSRMESGKRVMRVDTAERVASAFGLSLGEAVDMGILRIVTGR